MLKRILFSILIFVSHSVEAEDFYVCNSGNGIQHEVADCSTAWDIGDVNSSGSWGPGPDSISFGDTIYLMDVGGSYTESLMIGSDGVAVTNAPGNYPVFSNVTNCVVITDYNTTSISNIACQQTTGHGIVVTATSNLDGVSVDNIYFNNIGDSAFKIYADTSSIIVTNITVSNSMIIDFNLDKSANYRGIELGSTQSGDEGLFVSINITDNFIDGGTTKDGIMVVNPTNTLIAQNEVTNVGHGIRTMMNSTAGDCEGLIIRHNYVHDTSDDSYWIDECDSAENAKVYGNLAINTGDDCFEVSGGIGGTVAGAHIINNTCINPVAACILAPHTNARVTFENNICYFDVAPKWVVPINLPINDSEWHMFVDLIGLNTSHPSSVSSSTFNNNIYYSSTGIYTDGFIAFDVGTCTGGTCFGTESNRGECDSCSGEWYAVDFDTWQTNINVNESESMTLDLRYVPYDYKRAAQKIIEAGLPEEYARKLYPVDKR